MTSHRHTTHEHRLMVARIVALAEAYGCSDLAALEADVDVVVRVEFMAHHRQLRSLDQKWRKRRSAWLGKNSQPQSGD